MSDGTVYAASRKADHFYNRFVKRGLDLVLSSLLLILLLPLFLIISIYIFADSGLPVFYHPQRGGYLGKPFRIFKFRTMVPDADRIGGGTTAENDPRITRAGVFLRRTKLDELPQLLNVFLGDMSFVGPRPELLTYTNAYRGEELEIFSVRPGITDFASLTFIDLASVVGDTDADAAYEKYVLREKNALRIRYAREVSFFTDVRLFFCTFFAALGRIFRALFGRKSDRAAMRATFSGR